MSRPPFLAVAAALLIPSAGAFATQSPPFHEHGTWPKQTERLEARCQEKEYSEEECRAFIEGYRERMRARAERFKQRCEKEGIAPEDCRRWISEQREKRRAERRAWVRERCREEGLSPEECRAWVAERREEWHARAERLRQTCADKGLGPEECRSWMHKQWKERREEAGPRGGEPPAQPTD
jgi:hypothetical protein